MALKPLQFLTKSHQDTFGGNETIAIPYSVFCAIAMPTCWDGNSLGDDNDHKSHMAYTNDGTVAGACPTGFNRRLPQVQLFVNIVGYSGNTHQLSDASGVWHVDVFNGWQEGKLQEIIDNCEVDDSDDFGHNPPCGCKFAN